MKEKFTGSDWHVFSVEGNGDCLIAYGTNRWKDGPQGSICKTKTGNKADSYLIAAAPKMYAMLEQFKEFTENMHIQPTGDTIKDSVRLHEEAQKILAEARGE